MNDVLLLRLNRIEESHATVLSYKFPDFKTFGITKQFVQDNHSQSKVNVLRGLHYQVQHPQGKLIRVLFGRIFDVVVDLRRNSMTFGQKATLELNASEDLMLWIPPGYAHGFLVLEGPAKVVYSVTDYRYEEFERTLLWSDPELGIKWPLGAYQPILSDKDRQGTSFSNCEYYS
jgi:dTDP-4-dehydrorhamnose 3,5-epimerase